MSKGGTIEFRAGQDNHTIADDEEVKIFAPFWVEKALEKLAPELKGAQFEMGSSGKYLTIEDKVSLTDLQAIARNERVNCSGIIDFNLFNGIKRETIIALRDLVRQTVIVGKDSATNYGGYCSSIRELNKEVYICDLPGLQFQGLECTGRHVLLSEQGDLPQGALDADIFEQTVGEKKRSFKEANQDTSGRFLQGNFKGKPVLFDTIAYQAFIMQDFILSALALNAQAKLTDPKDELNFKFLKYGAGFFAYGLFGDAKDKLSENLTMGVLRAIEQLFTLDPEIYRQIKRIELPFYREQNTARGKELLNEIAALCKKQNIEFASTMDDALAQTSSFKTATTNCADPHARTGNEMGYSSVDAAIAQNLKRKGNNFSPICNRKMGEAYVTINHYAPPKPFVKYSQAPRHHFIWTAIIAVVAGVLVKADEAIRQGIYAGWQDTFFKVGIILFSFEIMRFARDKFKAQQYKVYQHKTDKELDKLNQTQLKGFDIGSQNKFGLFSWEAYSKAFYAGATAKEMDDKVLMDKMKARLKGKAAL